MAPQKNIILIAPNDPCPCRSGKLTSECCMEADGTFRIKIPSLLPSDAITGFSHAKCFMRDSQNCSGDISPDRFMSKSVVDMFGAKAIAATFTWNDTGRTTRVDVETLKAQILCNRHGSALSPLDAVATRGFGNVFDAMSYVITKSLATKTTCYAVSGEGLELWALKVLFGAHAAMVANEGDALRDTRSLDFGIFQRALEGGALAPPRGLYLRRTAGQMDSRAGWQPQMKETKDWIAGLRFKLAGLEFELIIDPAGLDFEAIRQQYFYRPSSIDLIGQKRASNIFMSGPAFGTNEAARFSFM
ncbi:MAG TPA: SEC-C domain-containing protein [Rhizomicrobium sp.]|jgi:hypothetical protein